MSNLYKPETHEAYRIAAGILVYYKDKGLPQAMLQNEGKSKEEIAAIIKAYERLIESILHRSH